eukprot:1140532-Pelagomonas_calceolata.AAC.2
MAFTVVHCKTHARDLIGTEASIRVAARSEVLLLRHCLGKSTSKGFQWATASVHEKVSAGTSSQIKERKLLHSRTCLRGQVLDCCKRGSRTSCHRGFNYETGIESVHTRVQDYKGVGLQPETLADQLLSERGSLPRKELSQRLEAGQKYVMLSHLKAYSSKEGLQRVVGNTNEMRMWHIEELKMLARRWIKATHTVKCNEKDV